MIARGFPRAAPRLLMQCAVPFILAGGTAGGSSNQATMGNNGALSTLPVLPTTYSGGAWIYLPANAISAGSAAGWYWFVASSTTAGTVYNNRYTSGDPIDAIPASPTAFATTGPGVFSQTLASDITALTHTIPGGTMGANGSLVWEPQWIFTASGNNKIFALNYGGTAMHSRTRTATNFESPLLILANMGRQDRNVRPFGAGTVNNATYVNATTTTPGYSSIDTSQDQTAAVTLQLANATEYLILSWYSLLTRYGK